MKMSVPRLLAIPLLGLAVASLLLFASVDIENETIDNAYVQMARLVIRFSFASLVLPLAEYACFPPPRLVFHGGRAHFVFVISYVTLVVLIACLYIGTILSSIVVWIGGGDGDKMIDYAIGIISGWPSAWSLVIFCVGACVHGALILLLPCYRHKGEKTEEEKLDETYTPLL